MSVDPKSPTSCAVLQPLGIPADTIVVALFDGVDPPRFVFRQLEDAAAADTACAARGYYRLAPDESFDDGSVVLQPAEAGDPVIRCVDARGTDPRDLLEEGRLSADLLVLDDRATIEYAASLGRYQDVPLAPDRGYLLLSAARAVVLARGDSLPDLPSPIRSSLALDAVSSRYAHALHLAEWEAIVRGCDAPVGTLAGVRESRAQRVLYNAGDATARDLADRIVALLNGPEAYSLALAEAIPRLPRAEALFVSVGVLSDDLAERLAAGDDFAYIVSVSLDPARICAEIGRLASSAPWLTRSPDWPREAILPLVKTRPFALAARRPDGFGFDVRPDVRGGLRICGVQP
ncbi:MAG TPA: hypothetical protein VEC56_07350 [Candidatus Krumholzibacteria bacterium]|nr:hypothetical protein [Candidatus Krumholzibacteria bacterium]